ncbi:MAG: hypothetical protein QHH80_12700 [Anaerolineae bacterium]|nr:hypothetical protein [Anaerolineae bacterium]
MPDDDSIIPEDQALSWDYALPLATNPFMWWDFLRVVAASLLIMELLVFLMSLAAGDPILLPPALLALVAGILAALFAVATTLVYGNRYHARFTLDARGAQMEDAGQGRRFRWLMVVLGLMARRPGVAMSATAGPSGYGERVDWRDVRRVTVHRRLHVVTLSNSWRALLRLYCPPERFEQAAAYAQSRVAIAERRNTARKARAQRSARRK